MSYFINLVRVPSAGKMSVVLDLISSSHAATGRPGFITVPVSAAAPNQPRPGIISTLGGFATLDDIDAAQDALLQGPAALNRQNAIDAVCDRNYWFVSENLSGPGGWPSGYEAKVVSRTQATAKLGQKEALVDALLEIRDKVSPDVKPVVSAAISGPITGVRVTAFGASLQDLRDQVTEFRAQARSAGVPDLLGGIPVEHVGRVVYWANP